MDFMMEFLNLFVVPFVGVFLYWKKAQPQGRVFLLGIYSLLCVLNVIAMKFASFFAQHLLGMSILKLKDSVTYTAVALICTIMISVICIVFTDFIQIQFLMEKKNDCQEN